MGSVTSISHTQIEAAKGMIERRFVPMLKERNIPYSVDIFHTETDPKTIAAKICEEAEKLHVKAVVISHHQRSKLQEFFSVCGCSLCVVGVASSILCGAGTSCPEYNACSHPRFNKSSQPSGLCFQVYPKVLAPARDCLG